MCGVDIASEPLKDTEYVTLLSDKLADPVITEIESVFETYTPALTWNTLTTKKFKALLLQQYSNKEPDISSVLKCFCPDRFQKPKDVSVVKYYHDWRAQLSTCLKPTTDEEHRKANDLVP